MEDQTLKELKELNCTVGEIKTDVRVQNQQIVDFFKQYANDQRQNEKDHNFIIQKQDKTNGRVKFLEKAIWTLFGGLTALGFLLGWLFDFVKDQL